MGVLYALESIRTPALDKTMSVITLLGGELFFMVIAVTVFWCVSKREGYYLMIVGFFGTVINQFLKIALLRAPAVDKGPGFPPLWSLPGRRPRGIPSQRSHTERCGYLWRHRPVYSPRLAAGGAGRADGAHRVQPDVSGCPHAAGCGRVVPDRGGAGAGGLSADGGGRPAAGGADVHHTGYGGVQRGLRGVSVPAGDTGAAAEDTANYVSALENGWKLLGATLGMLVSNIVDRKHIRFETQAVWWAQLIKLAVGFGCLLAIRSGLKAPLIALLGGSAAIAGGIRYLLVVLFAGCVWPLTFWWFSRLGKR